MTKQKQGLSNILATVLLIAIAVVVGGVVLVMSTDLTKTQLASDSIDIVSSTIVNTDTTSYLTVSIKNTGNSELQNITAELKGFDDGSISEFPFEPDTVRPSKNLSLSEELPVLISEGKSMVLTVYDNSTLGGTVSETIKVRP